MSGNCCSWTSDPPASRTWLAPHPRAHVPVPPPAFWASASFFSFKEKALPPPFGLRPLPLSSGGSCPGSPCQQRGVRSQGLDLLGAH